MLVFKCTLRALLWNMEERTATERNLVPSRTRRWTISHGDHCYLSLAGVCSLLRSPLEGTLPCLKLTLLRILAECLRVFPLWFLMDILSVWLGDCISDFSVAVRKYYDQDSAYFSIHAYLGSRSHRIRVHGVEQRQTWQSGWLQQIRWLTSWLTSTRQREQTRNGMGIYTNSFQPVGCDLFDKPVLPKTLTLWFMTVAKL